MSDGGVNSEGGARVIPPEERRRKFVEDRAKRAARRKEQQILRGDITLEDVIETPEESEKRIAHEDALRMDRSITRVVETSAVRKGILQGFRKIPEVSMREAKDRVSQRPEFRLTNESQLLLDDIHDALERDSFGEARAFIGQTTGNPELNLGDVQQDITHVIRERARTLVEKGDGEHFVACVAFLGEHLSRKDLPKETLKGDAITNALREHAISVFQKYYRDPREVGRQLTSFYRLELLKAEDVLKIREIEDFVGPRLVADFNDKDPDFVNRWDVYKRRFGAKSQTFQEIQALIPGRIEEMFRDLEGDPRASLISLFKFIDFGFISEAQVKKMSETVAGVKDALSRLDSDGGDDLFDPDKAEAFTYLQAMFGK